MRHNSHPRHMEHSITDHGWLVSVFVQQFVTVCCSLLCFTCVQSCQPPCVLPSVCLFSSVNSPFLCLSTFGFSNLQMQHGTAKSNSRSDSFSLSSMPLYRVRPEDFIYITVCVLPSQTMGEKPSAMPDPALAGLHTYVTTGQLNGL